MRPAPGTPPACGTIVNARVIAIAIGGPAGPSGASDQGRCRGTGDPCDPWCQVAQSTVVDCAQAACRACPRAGARGGARACRPMCVRIFSTTGCSRIATRPQTGHPTREIASRVAVIAARSRCPGTTTASGSAQQPDRMRSGSTHRRAFADARDVCRNEVDACPCVVHRARTEGHQSGMAAAAYDACIHRTEVRRSRNRASRQAVDHGHTKAIRRGVDGSPPPARLCSTTPSCSSQRRPRARPDRGGPGSDEAAGALPSPCRRMSASLTAFWIGSLVAPGQQRDRWGPLSAMTPFRVASGSIQGSFQGTKPGASTKARTALVSYWLWRDQPSVDMCAT